MVKRKWRTVEMTKSYNMYWRVDLLSHPLGQPYIIRVSVGDDVIWNYGSYDLEEALKIYGLLEQLRLTLRGENFYITKEIILEEEERK